MTGKPDNWMPLYISRYLQKTTRLTTAQHGAYLLLIMDSWINGPPPDEARVLRAICKATMAEWRKLRPVLEPYFAIVDGKWVKDKIEEERGRASEIIERKRAAGAAGGAAARGKSGRKNSKRIASAIPEKIADELKNELQNNTPLPLPLHSPSGEGDARAKDLALFAEICRMLGYDPNDARNFGDFIAILATDGVSRETLLAAAQHHKRAGRTGNALKYLRPKAIELRDLAVISGPAPVVFIDCDDDEWRGRIRTFERRGLWPAEWGPKIGEPGCRVPRQISTQPQQQKERA